MTDDKDLLRLVRNLAAHPVLPSPEALPPNDEAFHALLADLARAGESSHAGTLRAVSADLRIPVEELSRRAQFLLACLLLPASGTHYEVLGVARDATKQEIRKRWAALIRRYHPDRMGGAAAGSGSLNGRVRQLIEAYQTLKDPARRRAYDAQLAGDVAGLPAPMTDRRRERTFRFVGPSRWKWAPAGIAAVGIAAGVWIFTGPPPEPLPRVPLPAAPRLLDRWGTTSTGTETPAAPVPHPVQASGAGARHDEPRPPAPAVVVELPSLKHRVAAVPLAAASPRTPTESSAPLPAPVAVGGASTAEPPVTPPSRAVVPPAVVTAPSPPPPVVARPAEPAPPAVAAATPTPTTAAPAAEAPARAETLALIESFRAAYERKDLTAVMALFGAEARDRNVTGRQPVEQLYVKNFAALDGIRYDLAQLGVKAPAGNGDLVVEGRFRIRATRLAGQPSAVDVAGPIRWLLRREDGALRIVGIEYEASAR